jgi:hypothetical protein
VVEPVERLGPLGAVVWVREACWKTIGREEGVRLVRRAVLEKMREAMLGESVRSSLREKSDSGKKL